MQGQRHPFVVLLCASSACGSADQLLMASVVTVSTVTGFTCVPLRTVVKIARTSETIHQSKWRGIWTTASYMRERKPSLGLHSQCTQLANFEHQTFLQFAVASVSRTVDQTEELTMCLITLLR